MDHLPVPTTLPGPILSARPAAFLNRSDEARSRQSPTLGDWIDATLTAACLADRGRAIDVDLHDEHFALPGDADASAQAVLMLLSNACRFSAGGSRLRLTTRVQWADGSDHLVISVCDRGIGMTRAALQRAFDPIVEAPQQADRQTMDSYPSEHQGGLRIARSLMERQGGWIELRSALGIGTEAEAWVPVPVSADRQA
jgi:two-component system cell cycle sensor histidine kinase PleC